MSVTDHLVCSIENLENIEWEHVKGYSSLNYAYEPFDFDRTILDPDKYGEVEEKLELSGEDYRTLLMETMENKFSSESRNARMLVLRFLLRFDEEYNNSDCIFDFDEYPLNDFVLEAVFGDKTEIILNYHLIHAFNNFCKEIGFFMTIPKSQVGKNIVTVLERFLYLAHNDRYFNIPTSSSDTSFLYTESYGILIEDVCNILEVKNKE